MAAFEQEVGLYAASKGLPCPIPRVIDHHINMTEAELAALDADAVGVVAASIAQYAYFLQDLLNQKRVRIKKCEWEIKKLVLPKARNYDAFKDEDKLVLAALDHDVARALLDIKANAEAEMARYEHLGHRLADFADKLDSLHNTRRGNRYGKN